MSTEETSGSLLDKAVQELNEKDEKGAVGQIKTLMKLVLANDAEVAKLQANSKQLKEKIAELAGAGALSADTFSA